MIYRIDSMYLYIFDTIIKNIFMINKIDGIDKYDSIDNMINMIVFVCIYIAEYTF